MAKAAETAVAEQENDDRAEKQHGKDSQQSDEESAAAFKNGFQCGSESEDSTETSSINLKCLMAKRLKMKIRPYFEGLRQCAHIVS